MANTITTEVDGKEVEVEVPDDYIPKSEVEDEYVRKDYHTNEIERVKKRFKGSARDEIKTELKQDETFIGEVLEEHGQDPVDLDAHRRQWEEDDLQPVQSRLQSLESRVRTAEITEAAREVGIKDEFLKGVDGAKPPIVTQFEGRLEHDDDHGLVVTGKEGQRLPGSNGKPYATVQDQLTRLKESGDYDYLFNEPETIKGKSNYNNAKGGVGKYKSKADFENDAEIIAFTKEHGVDAYENLPDTNE